MLERGKRTVKDEGMKEEGIFVLWKVKGYSRWIFETGARNRRQQRLAPAFFHVPLI